MKSTSNKFQLFELLWSSKQSYTRWIIAQTVHLMTQVQRSRVNCVYKCILYMNLNFRFWNDPKNKLINASYLNGRPKTARDIVRKSMQIIHT